MIDLTPYALPVYPGHFDRSVGLKRIIAEVNQQLRPHHMMIRLKGTGSGPYNNLQDAGEYYLWNIPERKLIEADVDPVVIARTLKVPRAFARITRGTSPRLAATPSTVDDDEDHHPGFG